MALSLLWHIDPKVVYLFFYRIIDTFVRFLTDLNETKLHTFCLRIDNWTSCNAAFSMLIRPGGRA